MNFSIGPGVIRAAGPIRAKSSDRVSSPARHYRERLNVLLYRDAGYSWPDREIRRGQQPRYLVLLGRTKGSIVRARLSLLLPRALPSSRITSLRGREKAAARCAINLRPKNISLRAGGEARGIVEPWNEIHLYETRPIKGNPVRGRGQVLHAIRIWREPFFSDQNRILWTDTVSQQRMDSIVHEWIVDVYANLRFRKCS